MKPPTIELLISGTIPRWLMLTTWAPAEMARDEIDALEPQLGAQEARLQALLLPKDPFDDKNVIVWSTMDWSVVARIKGPYEKTVSFFPF